MILIIEDESSIAYSLKRAFERIGVEVCTAKNGREGLKLLYETNPTVVILDIKLPDMDGLTILQTIRDKKLLTSVIMITYLNEVRLAVKSMKLGAYDYYTKPFSVEEVVETAMQAQKYSKVRDQLQGSVLLAGDFLPPVFGNGEAMKKLLDTISKLAQASVNVTILLQGASGVGKEVIAKLFHFSKYHSMERFVAINCAAIPKTLLESELFGFEKGSFSEAKAQKIGLIEQANGGTLFLDEIGDMDLELQAKILRVLQEKNFRRIGGLREISFEANVISATNKNLEQEIYREKFREDLYYRLSTISLKIPSLASRKEDILEFLQHFLSYYNQVLGKAIKGYTPKALEVLVNYEWPGNIRQIKSCVERAAILLESDYIAVEDLPQEIISESILADFGESSRLDHVEGKKIMSVLSENYWNITQSAQKLGISRLTLRRKIQKYGLSEFSHNEENS